MPTFRFSGCSDPGPRDEQQDAYATTDDTAVIADGMGGHAGGAEAAETAVRSIVEELDESSRDAVEGAIGFACSEVDAGGAGGTTVVLAHLVEKRSGLGALVAWIGDSRAYLVREGTAELLTEDHVASDGGLSRWIPDEGTPDVVELDLRAGDRLVLCTDGVSDVLDEEEIALIGDDDDDDPAQWLVEQALDAGASDNCTVVVCVVG